MKKNVIKLDGRKIIAEISSFLFILLLPFVATATNVFFETPLGTFEVELFDDETPGTVANFLKYVNDGDFDNTLVHRSAAGFVIQGGGFTFIDGSFGSVPTDPQIQNEFNRSNTRGTIAMARLGGQENSATSQWFINLSDDNTFLDDVDGGFTVFGRVSGDGMTVVDAIAALPRWNFSGILGPAFGELPLIGFLNDRQDPTPLLEELVTVSIRTESTANVTLVAAVLPGSRSVSVGSTATAFATIINAGSDNALDCRITPITSITADFFFQTTDAATNALTGTRDAAVNIAAGAAQTFVFGFTPTAAFGSTDIQIQYICANSTAAGITTGVNTLQLSASTTPIPDIVALGATVTNDAIAHIPGATGTGFFSLASVNVGSSDTLMVSVDTGTATVPIVTSLCETDPATAACVNPTVPTTGEVTLTIGVNATPTFAVFVQGTENIALDAANKRVFVRFKDGGGVTRGSTSVAVQTD